MYFQSNVDNTIYCKDKMYEFIALTLLCYHSNINNTIPLHCLLKFSHENVNSLKTGNKRKNKLKPVNGILAILTPIKCQTSYRKRKLNIIHH